MAEKIQATASDFKELTSAVRELTAAIKSNRPPGKSLEMQLRNAADWWHDEPRLSETKVIQELIAEGFDLYEDILPAVRAYEKQAENRNSWNFFASVIRNHELERRNSKTSISAERAKQMADFVYAADGSEALSAWKAYYKAKGILGPPLDNKGGWWFESEFPNQDVKP
jgi:hypothetical protein